MSNKNRIFLASPHMSDEGYEMQYIKDAFETNWIAPLGKNVNEFENEIRQYVNGKAAVALSSGTAAMHLALKLAGVGKNDIVFCQSLTFSATANPIVYEGAIPVFIDSSEDNWNMSPDALEKAFIEYEKLGKLPKAVIVVNLYGIAADYDRIKKICDKYEAVIIEDAAESLGTEYNSLQTGSIGKYSVLSFNGNKIITTSGGGMLICNGEYAIEDAKKALFWATQARDAERFYQHSELGYNYRMSNITAGIGRGQLKVLKQRIDKKRYIYNFYKNELGAFDDFKMMPICDESQRVNCWLSCMIVSEESSITPDMIIDELEKENIEARRIWKPMHLQPFYQNYDYIDNGAVSERLFMQGICLPSDTKMTDDDLKRICFTIKELLVKENNNDA